MTKLSVVAIVLAVSGCDRIAHFPNPVDTVTVTVTSTPRMIIAQKHS
jgi:hypothetical protein